MISKEMKLPKSIKSSSLIETIVEIRLIPNPDIDRDLWAGILMARLGEAGYEYQAIPQLNVTTEGEGSIKLTVDKENTNSTLNLFVNEGDGIRLLIDGSNMSFNCSRGKYIGWNRYFAKIAEVLEIVEAHRIVQSYERTMIRYISEYDFNILDQVEIDVNSHTDNKYNTLEIRLTRQEKSMTTYISISGLRERVSKFTQEKKVTSLFDVNVFDRLIENATCKDVCDSLHSIHNIEKESFFGLLKESYVKSLNPEY